MNSPSRPWRSVLIVLALLGLLSVIAIEPPDAKKKAAGNLAALDGDENQVDIVDPSAEATGQEDAAGSNATGAAGPSAGSGATATGGATGPKTATKTAAAAGLECRAGKNGGATAPGVSARKIRLAATNVRSGTGSSFLGTAYIGMQAVVNRVNAQGGICGRLLELRLVDDAWEAARGGTYIATFARDDYFALPVVPSSEGLTHAISNGTISGTPIPVIGSDGMLKHQYADKWVWPVATSTVSTMRVMTKHAYDQGARTFGIVYDKKYRFGKEGAVAYKQYVESLPGAVLKAYKGIDPGQGSYKGDAEDFNNNCGSDGCQFVAFLLTPETAVTYISSQPEKGGGKKHGFGTMFTGGAQPLFNERFARDCKQACDGMLVWTGYNPPIGRLQSEADVAAYVDDVQSVDPGVDVNNQFLQGAYLGMKVFVAALQKVGPQLTREGVRDVMNSMTYESSLSSPLTWKPDNRFANLSAQPFRIVTASGDFAGFAEVGTGFLRDPTPGVVPEGD